MEVEVLEDKKLVVAWLRKDEEKAVSQPIIDQYRGSSYRVVVFRSGKGDLVAQTGELLRHNKEVCAREATAK